MSVSLFDFSKAFWYCL